MTNFTKFRTWNTEYEDSAYWEMKRGLSGVELDKKLNELALRNATAIAHWQDDNGGKFLPSMIHMGALAEFNDKARLAENGFSASEIEWIMGCAS